MANLLQAFPDKSEEERIVIAKKFYRNFIDNWIETIKLLSISKRTMNKRVTGNFEIFHQLYGSGKYSNAVNRASTNFRFSSFWV